MDVTEAEKQLKELSATTGRKVTLTSLVAWALAKCVVAVIQSLQLCELLFSNPLVSYCLQSDWREPRLQSNCESRRVEASMALNYHDTLHLPLENILYILIDLFLDLLIERTASISRYQHCSCIA